jgi:hypothetical protein
MEEPEPSAVIAETGDGHDLPRRADVRDQSERMRMRSESTG